MEKAQDFLFNRETKLGMEFGLKRMEDMLKEFSNPERNFRSIHLAGTNGKGSTLNALKEILMAEGLKIGSFTSPHLEKVNERIMINQMMITDEDFLCLLNKILPILEEGKAGYRATYFEIITVLAILFFEKSEVDITLFETGLGGRLDSTNVITPLLSIITSISLDHTSILGDSLEEIAYEKAGIIKKRVPVISGVIDQGPSNVIEEKAINEQSSIYRLNSEIIINDILQKPDFQSFSFSMDNNHLSNIDLKMLGNHQINNAALSIAAVFLLNENYGLNISEESIRKGLKKAMWAGRFEVLPNNIILDGSHNPEGMNVLIDTLKIRYPDKNYHFVFTSLKDKDYKKVISMLDCVASSITFTQIPFARATTTNELLMASTCTNKTSKENWKEAIKQSMFVCGPNDLLIVTGSLYFIGLARPYIKELLN
ncbi:bifunctional folylpolyglutamate synthase/dihydrofolate synthase [Peribacillus acanthi]|uniref:bifunctional folylpolyglutamate synthase/dihydrofolate synthase n=1 Tax=Peribacillus acanthi TaxID=2171554 RepID=UPI001F0C319A|nr:folylpolyglutamate synthase/dihydrofolate synthase family protein [Peribacillus acanthi]